MMKPIVVDMSMGAGIQWASQSTSGTINEHEIIEAVFGPQIRFNLGPPQQINQPKVNAGSLYQIEVFTRPITCEKMQSLQGPLDER